MARLYLVDGMSHIYRAYYAIRDLTNKDGVSTNAVYGFTIMLRKLISDESPDYLAVALDLTAPTVRHQQYKEYKATRRKMPEDLAEQIPFVRKICRAMRIPVLDYAGYEADDVIGTLTRLATAQGLEVVIVTIDKDMLQLVGEQVSVLDTRSNTRLTPDRVKAKWGVRPDQIVDVLSLVGDTSDNIPGAPGIGEKGARSLIAEFGSLEHLIANSDRVSRKSYRESLQQNEKMIRQSRTLLEIERRLPLELDLDSLELEEADHEALREIFHALGFTSLLQELPGTTPASLDPSLTVLKSKEQLESLKEGLRGARVGFSVWYRDDDPWAGELEGVSLATDRDRAFFIGGGLLRESKALLMDVFSSAQERTVHDLKSWLLFCNRSDWNIAGSGMLDTMLMAYLLEPNQRDFSLSRVAQDYLQVTLQGSDGPNLLGDDRPLDLGRQAIATLLLAEELVHLLAEKDMDRLLLDIELPLVGVLTQMEATGVRIDVDQLQVMSLEMDTEIARVSQQIFSIAGEEFNLNSPRQLAFILFEKLNLPSSKKTGKAGHLSTGVEVLEELAVSHEIAQFILDYRELAKLKGTYIDALPKLVNPETGRIHTSYNQVVASTGRLSSSNPNLQNIPIRSEVGRRIRRAFVPEEGFVILSADYSQIELRVMAHLSEDPVLLEAFRNGEDIHQRTAKEVFGEGSGLGVREQRRRAKVINFGIMYGLSAFGLARSLKIDRKEAQRFINDYFDKYQGVRRWADRTLEDATKYGFVSTLFGRIRQIPEINSKNWNLREFARRTAINAPIQGTAADLIKLAMVAIHRRLMDEGRRTKLILQVHDELVLEVAADEVEEIKILVRKEMESAAKLAVPLKVDLGLGPSWYEAK